MKKPVWLAAQIVWLAVCVAALIEAFKGYRGLSDWQVEEGLGFEMLLLSFPTFLVVVLAFIVAGRLLRVVRPCSSSIKEARNACDLVLLRFFVLAGYVQYSSWLRGLPAGEEFRTDEAIFHQ